MNKEVYLTNLKEQIEIFTKLSNESWLKVSDAFTLKDFKKGDLFAEEGKVCKYVGFNLQGIFREYFYHDGIDKTSDFVFENAFFSSYISFSQQVPSDVYIEALTDVTALVMDYESKQALFELVPEWDRLARLIAEDHFTKKTQRANMLASMTAKEKYLDLLKNGNPEIIQKIPQQYIASFLGITPETLSRIRKKL